jgi:hypothetical protein
MDIVIYAYEHERSEEAADAPAAPSNDEIPAAA